MGYVGKVRSTAVGENRFLLVTIKKFDAITDEFVELSLGAARTIWTYHFLDQERF